MRRYQREITYRPRCANAGRSWRLARFALVVGVLTALLLRYGFITPRNALIVFACTLGLALVALLLAIAAFRRIWREDDRGIGSALLGFGCAALVLIVPLAMQGYLLLHPARADVSTDLAEPPPFSRGAAAFAFRGGIVPTAPSEIMLARQAEVSPDVVSLIVDTDADELFQQVQEIARSKGWALATAVPPGGRFGDGHVDMAARTWLLRLPVDMTVRIRPVADGTRVDVRCTSRYPYFDISDNAALVRALLEELAKGPPLG